LVPAIRQPRRIDASNARETHLMRKALLTGGALLSLVVAAAGANGVSAQNVGAEIDGYQIVPTISSAGNGSFRARIDRTARIIQFQMSYEALEGDILQSHIHFGRPATNGGIVAFLCTNLGNEPKGVANPKGRCPGPRAGDVSGIIQPADVVYLPFQNVDPNQGLTPGEFDELVAAIDTGAAYVVIHTSLHPPGELRGNIRGGHGGHD
jgi:CHRD domain